MTNWTQVFGVILILGLLNIRSTSAEHSGRTQSFDDGKFSRVSELQGRMKTRRMMMGLGAEMDWVDGTPEFQADAGNRHIKRGRPVVTLFPRGTESRSGASNNQKLQPGAAPGSATSKSASFRDSVIVLRNHKRSEGQRPSGARSGSSASKSDSFRDSVIVLRNHKRTDGQDVLRQMETRQPEIVLKNSKRSEGNPSSQSFVRDPAIVLRSHQVLKDKEVDLSQDITSRPALISERSPRHSSQILNASPKYTSSTPPLSDSAIVLKEFPPPPSNDSKETAAGH